VSKFLRTAAEIVGVAALAVTGVGAVVGAAAFTAFAGITAGALAADIGLGAAALGVLGALTAKKPATIATPTEWQSDPQAGVPHIGGRMYASGQIVYRATFDKDNVNETLNTVYSTGPIRGFEGWYFSGVLSPIDGNGHPTNVVDGEKIFLGSQLGRQPELLPIAGTNNPGITAASKLSGLAASTVTFSYDTTGGRTFTTEPNIGAVVLGTPVYDPRQDSTYPGGAANGPQRWNDETTWSFTGYDNPGLKALSWLIGYRQNGYIVAGVGLPLQSINVAQFVEMANVCDANGWKCGFEAKSTDPSFQVFAQILQAGGAVPTRNGAITGCMVNAPKVSLATFEIDDIIGSWSVQGSQSRRDRINAIVPRYMAEQSFVGETTDKNGNIVLQTTVTWGMQAAGVVAVASYAAEDGVFQLDELGNIVLDQNDNPVRVPAVRLKGVDYPYVTGVSTNGQAPPQVAQLARYDIENAREFGPITLPMKPRWMGYRAGDVITGGASVTELGLVGQDIMIMQRQFSAANMTVTMTARSETAAKHAFALGQTTIAPPTPVLSGPPLIPTPGPAAWALTAGQLTAANGTAAAALFLTGAPDSSVIDAIIVEMRVATGQQDSSADWEGVTTLAPNFSGQLSIVNVMDEAVYQVAVSYRTPAGVGNRLILGPATAGQTAVPWTGGVVGPGKPEDGATVGAPAGTDVGGREAAALVSDVDLNANTLLAYQFDQQTLRDYVNGLLFVSGVPVNTAIATETSQRIDGQNALAQEIGLIGASNPAGSAFILNLNTVQLGNGTSMFDRLAGIDAEVGNVADSVTTINSQLGTAQASITTLNEVLTTPSGGASAKALFQLGANGHVVGYAETNDGTTGAIVFDFDSFTILRPDGAVLLTNDGDTLKLPSVEIDTLKISTAVTPVRASATSTISGTYSGSLDPLGNIPQASTSTVLTVVISMQVPGWIEATAVSKQGFAHPEDSHPWAFALDVNGTLLPEAYTYGQVPQDTVPLQGSFYATTPGNYTVNFRWAGDSTTSLIGRSLFVKGYPFT
jgi:hypothetical protein